MRVTGNTWWQHFISAITLSVFHITWVLDYCDSIFLEFKLSARPAEHRRVVFEAFSGVEWRGCAVPLWGSRRESQRLNVFPSYSEAFGEGNVTSRRSCHCHQRFSMPALLSKPDQCDDSRRLTVFTSAWKTNASNHSERENVMIAVKTWGFCSSDWWMENLFSC